MILIGKTANCLLVAYVIAHGSVLKAVDEFVRMREITWSVKGNLKSYCSRSRRRRFTVLDFKSWAYSRIYGYFQQHFTAHAQKRLFMNFRCKFRHRRSIRRPRFPIRVQNFRDLATFSVDFYILYAECPPYFYFRFVWPTDLESIPHASTTAWIIPTKFEVDMTIRCRVIAFLSADTARDLVTLTFDLLTLNSCHTWRVTWETLPPSMKTLRLSVHPFLSYEL